MKGKGKGNAFEWDTARKLSLWVTAGTDKSQFVRSVMSGGHFALRQAAENQVGDLAPNGPSGEAFRKVFGIECKCYKTDPNWWHAFTYKNWMVEVWWKKISEECVPHNLTPLLIMQRSAHPCVVMMATVLCTALHIPQLVIPRMDVSVITLQDFFTHSSDEWMTIAKVLKETKL